MRFKRLLIMQKAWLLPATSLNLNSTLRKSLWLPMKLLADENFPPPLISELQRQHHNIIRISRTKKGFSDIHILEKARLENRVIVTFDKDFLSNQEKQVLTNVAVFDFSNFLPQEILPFLDAIIQAIEKRKKKKKHFILICSEAGIEEIKSEN